MTLPPKEYLRARRKDITAQIQALNEELRDLERMESALTGQGTLTLATANDGLSAGYREGIADMNHMSRRQRRRFETSIKDMVLNVLSQHVTPISALEILSEIKSHFGVEIVRTSLSPQLSRLKEDDLVFLVNGAWEITQKGLEEMKPLTPGREKEASR